MYCFWLVFGVTGLCLGDTMYMVSLSLVGVSRAVPIGCVDTPFTMLFATLFFKEQVTLLLLMGAILIVVDIWLVSQDGNKSNNMTREIFAMFLSLFLDPPYQLEHESFHFSFIGASRKRTNSSPSLILYVFSGF